MFRVGNCAGFSGDRVDAAAPVVDTLIESGGPSAVFFETLGERTVALTLYCCGPAGGGGVRWRITPRIRTQSYLMLPGDLAPGCRVQSAAEIAA